MCHFILEKSPKRSCKRLFFSEIKNLSLRYDVLHSSCMLDYVYKLKKAGNKICGKKLV